MAFSLLLDDNCNNTFSKEDYDDILSFISSVDSHSNDNMHVIRSDHSLWSKVHDSVGNTPSGIDTMRCDNQTGSYSELLHFQQGLSLNAPDTYTSLKSPLDTAYKCRPNTNTDGMRFRISHSYQDTADNPKCSPGHDTQDNEQILDLSSILHATNDFIHPPEPATNSNTSLNQMYKPVPASPHICNLDEQRHNSSWLSAETMHRDSSELLSPLIQSLNTDIRNKCTLVSILETIHKTYNCNRPSMCNNISNPSTSFDHSESSTSPLPHTYACHTDDSYTINMIPTSDGCHQSAMEDRDIDQLISGSNTPCSCGQCDACMLAQQTTAQYGYDSHNMLSSLTNHLIDSGGESGVEKDSQQPEKMCMGPYNCPEETCLEVFKSKQGLSLHKLKKHNLGKLYNCEECEFKTPRRKDLHGHLVSQHQKLMPGMKVYECKFCDYKCVDRQRLLEHEVIHTGVKQFSCPDCGKCYTTKRGLRTHFKFHSTVRPHKCNLCEADFKVKSKLTDHLKLVHYKKGEKPYRCGYCDHQASIRGNVNQHIRNVHKGKPILVLLSGEKKTKRNKNYNYSGVDGAGVKTMNN